MESQLQAEVANTRFHLQQEYLARTTEVEERAVASENAYAATHRELLEQRDQLQANQAHLMEGGLHLQGQYTEHVQQLRRELQEAQHQRSLDSESGICLKTDSPERKGHSSAEFGWTGRKVEGPLSRDLRRGACCHQHSSARNFGRERHHKSTPKTPRGDSAGPGGRLELLVQPGVHWRIRCCAGGAGWRWDCWSPSGATTYTSTSAASVNSCHPSCCARTCPCRTHASCTTTVFCHDTTSSGATIYSYGTTTTTASTWATS